MCLCVLSTPLVQGDDDFPVLTIWLSFFSIILFNFWITYSKWVSNRLGKKLNAAVITAADYTVLVTGLKRTQFTRKDLEEFFSHYGYVYFVLSKLLPPSPPLSLPPIRSKK